MLPPLFQLYFIVGNGGSCVGFVFWVASYRVEKGLPLYSVWSNSMPGVGKKDNNLIVKLDYIWKLIESLKRKINVNINL